MGLDSLCLPRRNPLFVLKAVCLNGVKRQWDVLMLWILSSITLPTPSALYKGATHWQYIPSVSMTWLIQNERAAMPIIILSF